MTERHARGCDPIVLLITVMICTVACHVDCIARKGERRPAVRLTGSLKGAAKERLSGSNYAVGRTYMKLILVATLLLALMAPQPAMAQSTNPTAAQVATLRKARLKIWTGITLLATGGLLLPITAEIARTYLRTW